MRESAGHRRAGPVPPVALVAVRTPGQLLDPETRVAMEARFGHDFGRVRVHADPPAATAARALHAQAFTMGSDIVFGAGRFAPSTPDGRRLLVHELVHVVQQSTEPATTPALQRCGLDHECSCPPDEKERVAQAMSGEPGETTTEVAPGASGAQPLLDLPGSPHACLLQKHIPFNRSGILRSSTGTVGETFEMIAQWDSAPFRGESSYCAAECGEYHQFVKGHMFTSSEKDGSNPRDVGGALFGGVKLEETVFHEDGLDNKPKARYGHRAEPKTMQEDYKPTRASGPDYEGSDFPNISIGTWADLDLTFEGKTMDVCNNVETSKDTWRVVYKGVIRP
jgi:hypothetical protein